MEAAHWAVHTLSLLTIAGLWWAYRAEERQLEKANRLIIRGIKNRIEERKNETSVSGHA